ncbi:MAG: thermonuclease family protein [Phycisphaerae bacterium]|nr:thermonuclease family protein [Saprospiraceae bacterium]
MRNLFKFAFVLGTLLLSEEITSAQTPQNSVKVLAVHDGDSYKIQLIEPTWVRIMGIDCPEIISNHITENQPYGVAIGDSIRQILKGQNVDIQIYGKDQYGRTLAKITFQGQDLADYILSKGWGHYLSPSKFDNATRLKYRKSRDIAKKNHLGIWAGNATNPKTWRKTHWK